VVFRFSSSSAASVGSFVREILGEGVPMWNAKTIVTGIPPCRLNWFVDSNENFADRGSLLESDIPINSASARAFRLHSLPLPPSI
jgi:hypothetical protein